MDAAQAQAICGDRDKVTKKLENSYSETLHSMELSSSGSMIEVNSSPAGN